MRFLVDECLHVSLPALLHQAGFEAYQVSHFGLQGASDVALFERAVEDGFVFVTNNAVDFLKLYRNSEVHAGLIIFWPNERPAVQLAMLRAVLGEVRDRADLINSVVEVRIDSQEIIVETYDMPPG